MGSATVAYRPGGADAPADLHVDHDLLRLERVLAADPADPTVAHALKRTLTRAGALARAHALSLEPDEDLESALALAQRPVLDRLQATAPDHVVVATHHTEGRPNHVCGCHPDCCCSCCSPGSAAWQWQLLEEFVHTTSPRPVLACDLHHHAFPTGNVLRLVGELGSVQDLSIPSPGGDADLVFLQALSNLRSLSIRGCGSGSSLAGVLGSFRRLESLGLGWGDRSPAAMEQIASLEFLRTLTIGRGRWLTDEALSCLAPPNLESLSVKGMRWFTGEGLEALVDAGSPLRELTLQSPRLSDACMLFATSFPSLSELTLRGTSGITDEGIAYLGDAECLRALELSSCEGITDRGFTALRGATALERLRLSCVPDLGAAACEAIAELPLRTLSVFDSALDDEGLGRLCQLRELETLHLAGSGGCRVTDRGLEQLLRLPQLRSVTVRASELTARSAAVLRQLPNLERGVFTGEFGSWDL